MNTKELETADPGLPSTRRRCVRDLVHQDQTSAHPLIAEVPGWSASLLRRMLWSALMVVPQKVELSSTCNGCYNGGNKLKLSGTY